MNLFVLVHDKGLIKGALTYSNKDDKAFKQKNLEGWGVYFAVNQFKQDRKEEHLIALRYAYADFDIAKRGDGQSREEKELKKSKLMSALLDHCPPTMIIDTSNGIQPLWELKDKNVSDENKKRYKNILKGIVEWSKLFGSAGDNVYDVSRILRLPDYYHQKEEPYLCKTINKNDIKYSYEELEAKFPYQEANKEKEYVSPVNTNLGIIDREISNIDFKDLIQRAFQSIGRPVSFDESGRMIDPIGGTTGTFIGRKGDRDYLCSSSHEPYKGNRITALADILQITNKEARKWIIDEYRLDYASLSKKQKIEEKKKDDEIISLYSYDDDVIPIKDAVKKDTSEDRFKISLDSLNEAFDGGFKSGDLVIISGASGMGKTTFSQTLVYDFCKQSIPCLYFSYECSVEHLNKKFLKMGIDEFYYAYTPRRNTSGEIGWIKEKIKEAVEKYSVKAIFIDHIDFLVPTNIKTSDNERIILKNITQELKGLAIELDIFIVLMAHIRNVHEKKDLDMHDIGYSAGIFQLADYVIMVQQTETKKDFGVSSGDLTNNERIIKIVKNRETGLLRFQKVAFNNNRYMPIDYAYSLEEINSFIK